MLNAVSVSHYPTRSLGHEMANESLGHSQSPQMHATVWHGGTLINVRDASGP
jgi:hypothetical protein